ncbi:OsmC family protein [Sedimenticola selenatireducens]|uniref:OsmC family protein n=1 Tax=Sedimenticola selenatireducens TaxID=191960 RepID=A0A2N6D193_9GAMM|nr:OsmC family protein [Sedimenticola selenatireducens]PLX63455.1 MAG: hypothetical protein C0630_00675 [Sedimenticola selenatireducens]
MTHTAKNLDHLVNGVDTQRIVELATNMSRDENYGKFRFRAKNEWINCSRSRTVIKSFYAGNSEQAERIQVLTVNADQPVFLAGQNTAPNAVEHYLNALVSCLNTTVVAHASVQGIPIESLDISAEGEMDARGFFGVSEDVSRGYQKVNVDIRAKTPADEATIGKLISFSPVYEMVSRAIPVEIKMTIQ